MNLLVNISKKMLPESVEAGKAAGITDIDVLEATDYCKNITGTNCGW